MNFLVATALLPLVAPLWDKDPIDEKTLDIKVNANYISKQTCANMISSYKKLTDSRLKQAIIADLAMANSKVTFDALQKLNKMEKDAHLRAGIAHGLYQLRSFGKVTKASALKADFVSPNSILRSYAVVNYYLATGDAKTVVKFLEKENSSMVIEIVGTIFSDNLKKSDGKFDSLFSSSNNRVKGLAAKIIAQFISNPDNSAEIKTIVNSKDMMLKVSCAQGLAARKKGGDRTADKLFKTKSSAVKIALSKTVNKSLKTLVLKLGEDRDSEIRKYAVTSMANMDIDKSVLDALFKKLGDENRSVCEAAAVSLAKVVKSESEVSGLIRESLKDESSQYALSIFLGKVGYAKYGKNITSFLKASSDAVAQKEFVIALTLLKDKTASPVIIGCANSKDSEVKKAIANYVAVMNDKAGFNALKKMTTDSDDEVAIKAFEAMGRTGKNVFGPELSSALKRYTRTANYRAAACWAVGKTLCSDKAVVKGLLTLYSKAVIPMESMKEFDIYYVRVSAYMALADLIKAGKIDSKSGTKEINKANLFIKDRRLSAYVKQVKNYIKDKPSKQKEIKGRRANLRVGPL